MFWSNHTVTLLNESWCGIGNVGLKVIPRKGEFIYYEQRQKYFEVLGVVHYVNKKHGIFVIIKELGSEFDIDRIKV